MNAELTLVRTTDEIFKEYEEVSNRLEKAQDRLSLMGILKFSSVSPGSTYRQIFLRKSCFSAH